VQTILWPTAIISALTALLNIPVNYLMIRAFGFAGAAFATSISRTAQFVMLIGRWRS
jgi:Na+-driven multidrug efflux pump